MQAADAQSCAVLGLMYLHGHGVESNPGIAFEYSSRACTMGLGAACADVGVSCIKGEGTAKDETRARSFFFKGCSLDDGASCAWLGAVLESGRGGQAEPRGAVGAYEKACHLGEPWGCANFGRVLRFGNGVAKDGARAVAALSTACDAKIDEACFHLAGILTLGEGVPKDERRAAEIAAAACERTSIDACTIAADLNDSRAEYYLGRACDANDATGCSMLALRFLNPAKLEYARARPYLTKACELGDDPGCKVIADLILGGSAYPRDERAVRELLRAGCAHGAKEACERAAAFDSFSDKPITTSVAGFRFGISVAEAARACMSANGSWSHADGTKYSCSAQPVRSFPWAESMLVNACNGKVCEVTALGPSVASYHAPDKYPIADILAQLTSKYGTPGTVVGEQDAPQHSAACARGDADTLRRVWWFRKPNTAQVLGRVVLYDVCNSDGRFLGVIYQDAAGYQGIVDEGKRVESNY